jgi:hypothetical protein
MRIHLIVLMLPVALAAGAGQTIPAEAAAQPVESKPEDRCATVDFLKHRY